jgi:hypothetical protein
MQIEIGDHADAADLLWQHAVPHKSKPVFTLSRNSATHQRLQFVFNTVHKKNKDEYIVYPVLIPASYTNSTKGVFRCICACILVQLESSFLKTSVLYRVDRVYTAYASIHVHTTYIGLITIPEQCCNDKCL